MSRSGLVILAVMAVACEVPKEPDFTSLVTVPLSNTTFGITDLQDELIKGNDSLALEIVQDSVILAISEFEKFNVDKDLAEDPIRDSTDAVVTNDIKLRDSSTANFSLGSIGPGPIDGLHNTTATIPPFTLVTTSRTLAFTNFSGMTIESGQLVTTVTNSTQATMSALTVVIFNASNQTRLDSFVVNNLAGTGQDITVTKDFLSPVTAINPIVVKVSGSSSGSVGNVPVDSTDLLTVKVLFDTKASTLTGLFPAQTLSKFDSVRSSSNSVVDTGYISKGKMFLAFTNLSLAVPSVVNFISPDFIDPGGNPMMRVVNVPAGNGQVGRDTVDLTGWQVRPKPGANGNHAAYIGNQHFGYNYTLNIQASTNPGNTISNGDGVRAVVNMDTLFFTRLSGLITQEQLNLDPRSKLLDIDKIDTITLSQAYFEVYAEHRIPFPTNINVQILGKKIAGASRSTTLTGPLRPYTGGAAQRDTIRTPVSKYAEVASLLTLLPDSIKLSGTALIGDDMTRGAIVSQDSLSFRVFLRAPLVFSLPNAPNRNILRAKPNELNLSQGVEDIFRDNIKKFHIRGTITNSFPVPIAVRFVVNNIANQDSFYTVFNPDTTFLFPDSSAIIVDKGQTNASGIVIQPKIIQLDYLLPDSSFKNIFVATSFRKKYRGLQVQLLTTNGTVRVSSNDFAKVLSNIEIELIVDEALRH